MTTTLEHVLAHYRTLEEPGYAVLVTGPWGVGKSYQVRQALPGDRSYWVSLFGLRSREEIHAALVSSAWDGGAAVAGIAEKAKALGEGMGGAARLLGAAPAFASAMLERSIDYDRPIVFDDLERCAMPLSETLGVLNDYVERRGCRVIVIAHDEKIIEELQGRREKLFGRTIRVEPQTEQAFDVFIARIADDRPRRLVAEHRSSIKTAFEASEAASLRVLRHVTEDLGRLLDLLEQRHLDHPDLVSELVRLFTALDVEVRADQLGEDDLAQRQKNRIDYLLVARDGREGGDRKPKPITRASERHPTAEIFNAVLSDELLVAMLIHGRYEREPLLAQLDRHPYLVTPADEPAWRVLWHHVDHPIDDLEDAARRLREDFDDRAITIPGEMLHVFALRVRLARLGLGGIEGTVKEVGDANVAYIDDLFASGRLPLPPRSWLSGFGDREGHDGLGFAVKTDEERTQFDRVYEHLDKMREQARERRLREHHGPELLHLVHTDADRFAAAICQDDDEHAETVRHPVLGTIDPQEFIAAWLSGERRGWRRVRDGLEARYFGGSGGTLLEAEHQWIEAVIAELRRKEEDAKGTWIQPAITSHAVPRRLIEQLEAATKDK